MYLSLVPTSSFQAKRRDPFEWIVRRPLDFVREFVEDDDDYHEIEDLEDLENALTDAFLRDRTQRAVRGPHQLQKYQKRGLKRRHYTSPVNLSDLLEDAAKKKGRFEVEMDVEGYAPHELNVKLVDDCLVIEGSHETKDQYGYSTTTFCRKVTIPQDVKLEELTCKVDGNGQKMVVSAPRIVEKSQPKERVIPITVTNRKELENFEKKDQPKNKTDELSVQDKQSSDKTAGAA